MNKPSFSQMRWCDGDSNSGHSVIDFLPDSSAVWHASKPWLKKKWPKCPFLNFPSVGCPNSLHTSSSTVHPNEIVPRWEPTSIDHKVKWSNSFLYCNLRNGCYIWRGAHTLKASRVKGCPLKTFQLQYM